MSRPLSIRDYVRLARARRKLLSEALASVAVATFAIRFLPFKRVVERLVGAPRMPNADRGKLEDAHIIAQVRWAVNACANRVPWRAVCFQRGLAAHAMLRRRGIASTLHYGVAQPTDAGLKAHVWVTAGDEEVVGVREAAGYTRLASFPPAP